MNLKTVIVLSCLGVALIAQPTVLTTACARGLTEHITAQHDNPPDRAPLACYALTDDQQEQAAGEAVMHVTWPVTP